MIVVGWILVAFGALATVVFAVSMFEPQAQHSPSANIGAMLLFGNLPLVAGAVLVRAGRARRRRRLLESSERQLLGIARANNGKLTASLVAMETPLSIDEARAVLDMFVTRGVVDMVVDENGVIIYHFRELMASNT